MYIYSYLGDNLKGTKQRGPFLVTDSTVCLFPLTFCTSIESKNTSYICDTLYKSFLKHFYFYFLNTLFIYMHKLFIYGTITFPFFFLLIYIFLIIIPKF